MSALDVSLRLIEFSFDIVQHHWIIDSWPNSFQHRVVPQLIQSKRHKVQLHQSARMVEGVDPILLVETTPLARANSECASDSILEFSSKRILRHEFDESKVVLSQQCDQRCRIGGRFEKHRDMSRSSE